MHPYLIVPMLACVGCAASAGMLFARSAAYGTSRAAVQILICGAYWALCEIAWNTRPDAESAHFWMRASALGWVWLGPSVAQLFLDLEPQPSRGKRRFVQSQYAFAVALLALAWTTDSIHSEAVATPWGWSYVPGAGFGVFYVFTILNVGLGLYWGRKGFQANRDPRERRQGKWLALALSIPLCVASLTDALLPMLGYVTPQFGSLSLAALGAVLSGNILYFGYSMTASWTFRQEMLSILPEGVALLGMDGHVRTANAALAELVGVSVRDLTGKPITEIVPDAPVAPAREVRDEEVRLRDARGVLLPVAVSSTHVNDRRGYAIGMVLVVRDLREVVSLRNRLITSDRLAAVGELAAGIAHEVNNPLAFIRTNLTLLESHWKTLAGAVDAARRPGLDEIVREGEELIEESLEGVERTASFVRDVKGLARAGSPLHELEEVNRLIASVIRVAEAQNHKNGQIVTDFGDLPLVRCSGQELKQVFLNLLINALQAIDEGGRVEVATRSEGKTVVVSISDDGHGIAPETVDRIYDPFFTTKQEGEGTGLGLAISAEIVSRHRGMIDVESSPGNGTRFDVWLPAAGDER